MSLFERWRRRRPPTLVALAPDHAAGCARLHGEAFAHPWGPIEFERLLAAESGVGDGATQGSRLAAFILSRRAGDEAEILSVAVESSARRQGLARELVAWHIARLARLRVTELFLEVAEDNAAARALYRRCGFAEAGRRRAYYPQAAGPPVDALILRRALEPAAPLL